jgi:hypothetical protein
MNDIHYRWNDGLNSVQIASDVSLPQFKVVGHRQKTIEASLSTGIIIIYSDCRLIWSWLMLSFGYCEQTYQITKVLNSFLKLSLFE